VGSQRIGQNGSRRLPTLPRCNSMSPVWLEAPTTPRIRHPQAVFGPLHVLQEAAAVEQQDAGDAGTAVEAGARIIDRSFPLQAERITRNGWALR
jgi:hypothetical protein